MTGKHLGVWLALALAASISALGCAPSSAPAKPGAPGEAKTALKIAMAFPGPISDKGYNQNGYEALQQLKEKLGAEVAFAERVPPPDRTPTVRDYANRRFDLVIGHGFEFADSIKEVAPQFPNVHFILNAFGDNRPNITTMDFRYEELGYVEGYLAGLVTKSNKLGTIIGVDIPTVKRAALGFEQGAKAANPSVQVVHVVLGDWDDAAKAKEAVFSHAELGVDLDMVTLAGATTAAIDAAKDKGIFVIPYGGDLNSVAPKNVLTSGTLDVRPAYLQLVELFRQKKLEGKLYQFGSAEDTIKFAPYYGLVTKDVEDKVSGVMKEIAGGKLKVSVQAS